MAGALRTMGFNEDQAQRLARECDRSVTILGRRIPSAVAKLPSWHINRVLRSLLCSRERGTPRLPVIVQSWSVLLESRNTRDIEANLENFSGPRMLRWKEKVRCGRFGHLSMYLSIWHRYLELST